MPHCITIAEYMQLPLPSLQWIVPGLLPTQSFTVLWGPPKSGKTLLSLQLGLAIANGTPFLGLPSSRSGTRVLVLQFDTGQSLFRSMLEGLAQSQSLGNSLWLLDPHTLASQYPVDLLSEQSLRFLHEIIAEVQPDLVIIDCLSELGSHDENEQHGMKAIVSALKSATTFHPTHPCAALLLHHTVKFDYANKQSPIPAPLKAGRGSGYLAGAADSIWFHRRLASDQDPNAVLHLVPRFAAPSNLYLRQGAGGTWSKIN
jgi:RecA-family ATPase